MKTNQGNINVQKGEIQSNGQTLYWESYGEGKPLILIMGIGYDSTLWGLHQVPAFSEHFKTIIFDNRDAGRSSNATKAYTIADMADDVAGLMDGLGIEKTHLLGLSMGGMIAQEFAIRYPKKLDKLVLTGTAAATARSKFDPISIWSYVKTKDAGGFMFAAQQFIWLFSESFNRNHEAVDQTLRMLGGNPYPVTAEAYQRQAEAYLKHDTLDRLNQVTAPTIVISGEQDRLTPPWICKEVADAIPNAKFTMIKGEGSSHVLPLERPNDFNQAVLSFLEE